VATELTRLRVLLDADPRLAAAIGGAARYLADAAGLEGDAVAHWQSSVLGACYQSFEHLTATHPHLIVTLTRFPDRLEVALSHKGEALPAVGLDTIAGLATQTGGAKSGPGVFAGVDRVQYESRGTEIVTLLTKYIRKVAPRR
jgi:hypothetical protein